MRRVIGVLSVAAIALASGVGAGSATAASVAPVTNRYSRPDLLWDVTDGPQGFVAVGNSGAVATSSDGLVWHQHQAATQATLRSVAAGDGRYVAAGAAGALVTSRDGRRWRRCAPPAAVVYTGTVFGNGRWVAVAMDGSTAVSVDGCHWTPASAPVSGRTFFSVTVARERYYAVTVQGAVLTSTDAREWTLATGGHGWLWDVVAGDGRIVAVGATGAVTSTDGIAWTATGLGTFSAARGVAFGKGKFIATGGPGVIQTSTDGIAWSQSSIGSTSQLWRPAFGRGTFVMSGAAGLLASSVGGVRWTRRSKISDAIYGFAANAHEYVAAGTNGTIAHTRTGHRFRRVVSPTTAELRSVTVHSGHWIITGAGGTILTSADSRRMPMMSAAGDRVMFACTTLGKLGFPTAGCRRTTRPGVAGVWHVRT